MAAGTLLALTVTLVEDAGSTSLPTLTMVSTSTVGDRQTITLASGDNTADTPPANSSGAVLIPSDVPDVTGVNVCALGYRTAGSAPGEPMRHTGFTVLSWDTPPDELIINAEFSGTGATPEGSVEVVYF